MSANQEPEEGMYRGFRARDRGGHVISLDRTMFSDCRRFRYTLRRSSLLGTKKVCFVMLNPSTADASTDDPTTRRAFAFAERLGCGEYLAVNLFALRSTDPKMLRKVDDPVGPMNDEYLRAAAKWADEMVVAWGTQGTHMNRDRQVLRILQSRPLRCLGKTKHGHPKFPLYLRANVPLQLFTGDSRE